MTIRLAQTDDLPFLEEMYRQVVVAVRRNGLFIWDDVYPLHFWRKILRKNASMYSMAKAMKSQPAMLCVENMRGKTPFYGFIPTKMPSISTAWPYTSSMQERAQAQRRCILRCLWPSIREQWRFGFLWRSQTCRPLLFIAKTAFVSEKAFTKK